MTLILHGVAQNTEVSLFYITIQFDVHTLSRLMKHQLLYTVHQKQIYKQLYIKSTLEQCFTQYLISLLLLDINLVDFSIPFSLLF